MKVIEKNIAVKVLNSGPMQTPSGLYIAPSADTAQIISGVVSLCGDKVPDTISEGMRVHFNKFTANKITISSTDYFVFAFDQILLVE